MTSDKQRAGGPGSWPTGDVPDTARVATFLAGHLAGDVGAVAPLGRGEWSVAYAFRHDGAEYVARFGLHREDFAKDQLAARYAAPGLPIPPVTAIGKAFGGHYAISARAFGGFLDDLDGPGLRAHLPALFAMLDAARGADLSATTGYGPWEGGGDAPFQSWRAALRDVAVDRPGARIHGWRAALARSSVGVGPFDAALAAMETLLDACPEERQLVHSDLLNRNVLVADGRIAAVIDWGCALYGDFLYDLAWLAFWSPWYPAWAAIDFARETARHYAAIGLAVPHFAERLRCYQLHIGLGGMAYSAFKGRWDDVEAITTRTLAIARADD